MDGMNVSGSIWDEINVGNESGNNVTNQEEDSLIFLVILGLIVFFWGYYW